MKCSVFFSWLFRGPRFGQILRVLALEQSSDTMPAGCALLIQDWTFSAPDWHLVTGQSKVKTCSPSLLASLKPTASSRPSPPPKNLVHFFWGGGVHAWNGYHLSFWRFLPCFIAFVAQNWPFSPLKRSVLGAWKGHIRARKGQMVNLGLPDPKTTWNAFKTRENITTPQLASLHGLPPNWAKKCYKTGEKKPRGQTVPISRAHGGGGGGGGGTLLY